MLKRELLPCVPAPKGLFPPEPEHYRGPKLKVAIIGAGLAGMSTAVELLDQGHEVSSFVAFSRAKRFLVQQFTAS
jgi:NADPH-dependent 2,4-dienoyl-CoA reductase/sulfur reductase-like enzyme